MMKAAGLKNASAIPAKIFFSAICRWGGGECGDNSGCSIVATTVQTRSANTLV